MGIFKRWAKNLEKTWEPETPKVPPAEAPPPVVVSPPGAGEKPIFGSDDTSRPQLPKQVAIWTLKKSGVDALRTVALLGVRGYYLDSMGKKGANDRGIYDDAIFIVGPGFYASFNANSDPSIFRKAVAVLKKGLWQYQIGIHGLSKPAHLRYKALVQAAKVTVVRDQVGDDTGYFGINIHKGGANTTSSIGCQTIRPDLWPAFISQIESEMKKTGQKTVPYLLMEGAPTLADVLTPPMPETPSVPTEPVRGKIPSMHAADIKHGWQPEYNAFIKERISADLMGASVKSLLKSEPIGEKKKDAICKLLQAMAWAESSGDPFERYVETGLGKDSVTGEQNTSEGLLQVSYQDANIYACEFDWSYDRDLARTSKDKTIFNPLKNIDCGMKILTTLLKNRPWESFQQAGARYWSVLRPERPRHQDFLKELRRIAPEYEV